jgi:hypothetical protein
MPIVWNYNLTLCHTCAACWYAPSPLTFAPLNSLCRFANWRLENTIN